MTNSQEKPCTGTAASAEPARLRWWNTLSFRVGLLVNLTVVVVLGASEALQYRRERRDHVRAVAERLSEESRVLVATRTYLRDAETYGRFLDDFCQQMGSAASPGHHIAIFDRAGQVVLRAHARANTALERAMATVTPGTDARFDHHGDRYIGVAIDAGGGERITVAQSLKPVEAFLARQRSATILSTSLLIVLIFAVTTIGLVVWLSAPLKRLVSGVAAIRRRCFETRVRGVGMSELGLLAQGVNNMAHSLEDVENRRRAEMSEARDIQRGLLPAHSDIIDGYELAATFLPAESVGGDLYDVVEGQDRSVILAVFDVSGHGVSAALCTALLSNVLRREINGRSNLTDVMGALNTAFADIGQSGYFATCVLVHLSPSGDLQYVSAGHEPVAVVRRSGKFEALDVGGLPLGVERSTRFDAGTAHLDEGDRLYVYTDGLHEVFDDLGAIFGRQRLARTLADSAGLPVRDQLHAVIDEVRSFNHNVGFDDDVTLLCASRR